MTSDQIEDVAALEARIGKTPASINLKVIDHLDAEALRWLAASPVMFAGFGSAGEIAITLAGGAADFVEIIDARRMRLPKACLDHPDIARDHHGFGALFLVPSIGETLRINGRVEAVDDNAIEIRVDECYVHCAKALMRSGFWSATPQPAFSHDPAEFLSASRFMALATVDAQGAADVSPKGDPAGLMIRASDDAAWFADRPGNRRADSFRNMLTQPRIAIAALIPGTARVALLAGRARISADENTRSQFAVKDRAPLLTTRIEAPEIVLVDSPTLERAQLWPAKAPREAIDPAATLAAHVRLNRDQGFQAKLLRASISTLVVQKGLDYDYKNNLY